jgi:predicted transcriptional regulator
MSEAKSDRVLVVEDGRFVGQVTEADVVAAIEVMQGLGARRDIEVADGYA